MLRTVLLTALLVLAAAPGCAADWPRYGLDDGGARYARDDQITPQNVTRLEPAWTFRTGDTGEGYRSAAQMTFEATPILISRRLYLSTGVDRAFALDATTGAEIWRFDPGLDPAARYPEVASRGVSWWRDAGAAPDDACAERIFLGTLDGRMIALDARTGRPCAGFGREGTVDLTVGVRPKGQYAVTSPPAVYGGLVIAGSAIGDNRAVELEYGVVRALDARTGAVVWSWDPLPRDPTDPAHAGWDAGQLARTGAGNVWAPISVDAARGLVFLPTGSASPDYYGGERRGDDLDADSLVALDARTGRLAWRQQLVRHDLWDYDTPAQPVLADLRRDGRTVPAVLQATKMGLLFVFDRTTGEPVFPLEERPVPASDVPGEAAAPTQRFPTGPPPLVPVGPLRPEDAWGLTPFDRGACRRRLAAARSEGIYTPPSLRGTVEFPSWAGGANWGGLAFDGDRQLAFVNVSDVAGVVRLVPRAEVPPDPTSLPGFAPMAGTPYALSREILLSPLGLPCNPPPWGTLTAVDLGAGTVRWQVPLGTTRDKAPWPWLTLGMPNLGGPTATATGLVFVAAATDDYLRAFDSLTGAELWRGRLPAGGQATPMTYTLDGRQYVVVAAGGHGALGTRRGDYLVAFALPRSP